MFTEPNEVDAGGLLDASLMLGMKLNENMRRELGIQSQDAFNGFINLGEQDGDLGWL